MSLIGLSSHVEKTRNSFPDLMLKEWAAENLIEKEEERKVDAPSTQDILRTSTPVDRLIKSANEAAQGSLLGSGTLVAASTTSRSPHLLNRQYMHKSVVLLIQEDEVASIGVILNRPSGNGVEITVKGERIVKPILFGGEFSMKVRGGLREAEDVVE